MGEEHDALVKRAARWLQTTRRCALVCTEPYAYKTSQIPDVIGWAPDGHSILVECKTSLKDYQADRNKPYLQQGYVGMGNERWYFTPPNLLVGCDLYDGWGLIVEINGRIKKIRKAPVRRDPLILEEERPLLVAITRRTIENPKAALHGGRVWAPRKELVGNGI